VTVLENPTKGPSGVTRILKNPIVYFFVLGFVVFGLHSFLNMETNEQNDDPFTIEVTSADIEWLRSSWESRMQRKPTPDELNGLVDNYIREEILAREAYKVGLDEQDLVIKRRLVQKMTFVFEDLAEAVEPTEEELLEYAQNNQETYLVPEMISFTHIYFNPDKRKDVVSDAEKILRQLQAGDTSEEEALVLGDAIMLDASYFQMTHQSVAGVFGLAFAVDLTALEGEGWRGPIGSSFGLHIVRINDRSEARMPEFASLRERVRYDFMYDRKKKVIDEVYGSVKPNYTILVEGLPYDQ
jgi:hypothetical protein